MELSDEQISEICSDLEQRGDTMRQFARAIEAEVRKGDTELIRQLMEALEYHRDQTRPIAQTDDAINAARARLEEKP